MNTIYCETTEDKTQPVYSQHPLVVGALLDCLFPSFQRLFSHWIVPRLLIDIEEKSGVYSRFVTDVDLNFLDNVKILYYLTLRIFVCLYIAFI